MTYTINQDWYSAWSIDDSNETWTVSEGVHITTGSSWQLDYTTVKETSLRANNHIIINGTVSAGGDQISRGTGISASGVSTEISVSETGKVSGGIGISLHGADQSLTNTGEILGHDSGIDVLHEALIKNDGLIGAEGNGIVTAGDGIQMLNEIHGRIDGQDSGIAINAALGIESRIVNYGKIEGGQFAITSADGNETIINHGGMIGKISLGGGDDMFDNRGGSIQGKLHAGLGNDTLIVDNASSKLAEGIGSGYDTIKSTVSYSLNANVENLTLLGHQDTVAKGNGMANSINGNSRENKLFGKGGADTLDGHAGNDMLMGGASADTFVFSTTSGKDMIKDFENGIDLIDLSDLTGVTDFADIKAHHLTVTGDDLMIHVGKDQLLIEHMDKANLNSSDFLFAV